MHSQTFTVQPLTLGKGEIIHLPMDKMATILQTIFWEAFSWMDFFVFWLKFHQILFVNLGPIENAVSIHWRICAALGGDEIISSHTVFMVDAFTYPCQQKLSRAWIRIGKNTNRSHRFTSTNRQTWVWVLPCLMTNKVFSSALSETVNDLVWVT